MPADDPNPHPASDMGARGQKKHECYRRRTFCPAQAVVVYEHASASHRSVLRATPAQYSGGTGFDGARQARLGRRGAGTLSGAQSSASAAGATFIESTAQSLAWLRSTRADRAHRTHRGCVFCARKAATVFSCACSLSSRHKSPFGAHGGMLSLPRQCRPRLGGHDPCAIPSWERATVGGYLRRARLFAPSEGSLPHRASTTSGSRQRVPTQDPAPATSSSTRPTDPPSSR